jgi:homocitrate synthase
MCAADSNGSTPSRPRRQSAPYQSVQDYLSNITNFKIIESTLREGEQFANAFFDTGMAPKQQQLLHHC